jgi:hypothetical protein
MVTHPEIAILHARWHQDHLLAEAANERRAALLPRRGGHLHWGWSLPTWLRAIAAHRRPLQPATSH